MILQGTMVFDKETKLYSVSVPLLGVWTQGDGLDEALFMAEDCVRMLFPSTQFTLQWVDRSNGRFTVESNSKEILPVILKEARLNSGLSLMEAAKKLGYKNQNSIYAYETGKREPSFKKLQDFLSVYGVSIEMQFSRAA